MQADAVVDSALDTIFQSSQGLDGFALVAAGAGDKPGGLSQAHAPPAVVQTPAVYGRPRCWHRWARWASPSSQARRRASSRSGDIEQPATMMPASRSANIASHRTSLTAGWLVAELLDH